MSDLLKVGSFNMKDNGINRNGGIREDGTSNAKYVANIIKEKEFDLLGTQELTIKYVNELALELHNYQFLGSYRYGNALKFLPYNENNNILTNQKVLETNTIWLPWIANNFPDIPFTNRLESQYKWCGFKSAISCWLGECKRN